MFVVCDETAEQAKRTRAKKEGKMKELLEQYKRIYDLTATLRQLVLDLPEIELGTSIGNTITHLDMKLDKHAHEIVSLMQNGKCDVHAEQQFKPLWVVLPADAEDDVWQKQLGPRKQLSYQLFLAQSHAEEYAAQLRKSKVVPVWGE
jgi:hypothetical protein